MQKNNDLRKAGLKVTIPRLKVLELFESADKRHMSAEDVYKKLLDLGEDVGLATVYRVLTQFETAGLLIRHRFEGEHSVFELNEGEHHDHLFCIDCGVVEEFIDYEIEARQESIARNHGFELTDHSLIIYGVCSSCKKGA